MINHTEHRPLIGVIVGGHDGDPDPQQAGRVRVLCPQIHNPSNFNPKDLPWSQLSSNPQDQGSLAFNRPPPPGSMVFCRLKGNAGHVFVDSVLNGKHSPQDLPGNIDLTSFAGGWLDKARNTVSEYMNGEHELKQTEQPNERSQVKKTTADQGSDKKPPSMKSLEGLFSNMGGPFQLLKKYVPVKNISTAIQPAAEAMNAAAAGMLPGSSFTGLGDMLNMIPQQIMQQLTSNLPKEVGQAIGAIGALSGGYKAMSGQNFQHQGQQVDPSTFINNAVKMLSNVTNTTGLLQTLTTLATDTTLHGLENLPNQIIEIAGPFGKILQTLSANGNIQTSLDQAAQQAQQAFSGLMSGIPAAADTFMKDSKIASELLSRLPIADQSAMKSALEAKGKDIHDKLNKAAKAFLGNGDNGGVKTVDNSTLTS